MAGTELLCLGRRADQPAEKGPFLDQRLPSRSIPVHVLVRGRGSTWLATQEDNDGIGFGRNKTEKKGILGPAVVAFEDCISQGRFRVKLNFFVSGTDEMIDNVRGCAVATGTAKPLVAGKALNNGGWGMNSAVSMRELGLADLATPSSGTGSRLTRRHVLVAPFLLRDCLDSYP